MKERALSRGVRVLGLSGVPGVTVGALAEAFQSSIRSRWAGRSVSRRSRPQSRWRPSSVVVGG